MVADPLFNLTKKYIRSILGRELIKNFVEKRNYEHQHCKYVGPLSKA